MCPRDVGDNALLMEKIDLVNSGIQGLCQDTGSDYTDCSNFLKLTGGSINDGYYVNDGVHLTNKGQDKLCQKLSLTKKTDVDSYCTTFRKPRTAEPHDASPSKGDTGIQWQTVTRKRLAFALKYPCFKYSNYRQ